MQIQLLQSWLPILHRPRVARCSQPRAVGWNPVGILSSNRWVKIRSQPPPSTGPTIPMGDPSASPRLLRECGATLGIMSPKYQSQAGLNQPGTDPRGRASLPKDTRIHGESCLQRLSAGSTPHGVHFMTKLSRRTRCQDDVPGLNLLTL